jgi:UMF1 family MFS transporter
MSEKAESGTRKQVISWALYDWANSAFSTTVWAGFFPVFFKEYWSAGLEPEESTSLLGVAVASEAVVVAALAPLLGAIADRGRSKKRFLLACAALGIVTTGSLWFVPQGDWISAVALFVAAGIGFAASLIFYDSLLVGVAPAEASDRVSALGYALGYLGGGILFALNVAMTLRPTWFGLADASAAVRFSFVTVAVWWALFSIPLFRFVREPPVPNPTGILQAVPAGFRQVRATFAEVRKLRVVFWFLLAYWLYIDGVDTVMRMAVDYGLLIGLDKNDLILALLITQFVGFPAALGFGSLAGKVGAKRGILIGLGVYLGVTVWGYFLRSAWEFYALAVIIGLVQGGVQALSRSLYSRIIPKAKAGEFFGFYNIFGKFAAIIGPLLMGWTPRLTGNPRAGIVAIAVLFIAGGLLLQKVDEAEGRRHAAELERV